MAQPTFKAAGTFYQGTTNAHTVLNDVSPAEGDFLLMGVSMSGSGSSGAIADPVDPTWLPLPGGHATDAGHFDVSIVGSSTNFRLALFYKIAGPSEPASYAVNTATSANTGARIFAWSGENTADPFGGVSTVWNADTVGSFTEVRFAPALTGLTTDHRIIRIGFVHTGTTPTTLLAPADGLHTKRGGWDVPNQARQAAVMDYPVQAAGADPLTAAGASYGMPITDASTGAPVGANAAIGVSFALAGTVDAPGSFVTVRPEGIIAQTNSDATLADLQRDVA